MTKKKVKILVVDDSPVTVKLLEKILANDGYIVASAWSGEEGLMRAREFEPELVVMDVLMPDIDGKEVVRRMQQDPQLKEMAVVFTTNTINLKEDKGNETIEVDGQEYRAFAKPIHHRKLLSTIRKEVNRRIHGNS